MAYMDAEWRREITARLPRIEQERDEAQEAAETYHAAWQDAAVYWKEERDELREQVARLEAQLDNSRSANNLRQRRLDVAVNLWSAWERAASSRWSECEQLRVEVKRWQGEFSSYAVHDDARCEHFGKCQCGLAELLLEIAGALAEEEGAEGPTPPERRD